MADTKLRREDQIDKQANEMFNPHPGLRDMENGAANNVYTGAGIDQTQAYANDPANATKNIDDAKSQEQAGTWKNNTGQDTSPKQKGSLIERIPLRGRKGAAGFIITLFLGGGLLGGALLSPGLLLVHLKEDIVKKLDTRAVIMAKREVKVLADKFASKAAGKACTVAPAVCEKFTKPGTKLLSDMEGEGATIEAKGPDGKLSAVDISSGEIPDNARITMPDGAGTSTASTFAEDVAKDPVKAGFFRRVFNPLFKAYGDSAFGKVLGMFKISKADNLGNETDDKKMKTTMSEDVTAGESPQPIEVTDSNGTDAHGQPNPATNEGSLGDVATSVGGEVDSATIKTVLKDLLEKSSKGGPAGMVIGLFCGAQEFAKTMSLATRVAQVVQLIRFSMIFLNIADMIKAGDAKPEQVAMLGTMLTTVMKDKQGHVTKQAATDGYGMKYVLGMGLPPQTLPKNSTSHFTSYIAGGGWASTLGKIGSIGGPALAGFCGVANSAFGSLVLSFTGGIIGIATNLIVNALSDPIASLMAPLLNKLVGALTGTVISSVISGEDAGDAFASGSSQLMSQTAASGGGSPLSPSEATAFENSVAQPYQVAQAQIDRATLSPFDISSQNTFLGSIYDNLIPVYSNTSSLSGIISAPFQILSTGLGLINKPAFAADGYGTTQEYDPSKNSCGDPSITVAAGPFCNIINAVPSASLNIDPITVLNDLSGQYDSSGNPTPGSDLANYQSNCMGQQSPETATDCATGGKYNPSKYSNELALYFIDQSVQRNMDGEDSGDGTSGSGSSSGSSTSTVVPGGTVGGDDYATECSQYLTGAAAVYCPGARYGGQCTAFVNFRLAKHGVIKPGQIVSGYGKDIVNSLADLGFQTGSTPQVNSVFSTSHTSHPSAGHTGIVSQVNADGSIVVEEYNFTTPLHYDQRTLTQAQYQADGYTFAYVGGSYK